MYAYDHRSVANIDTRYAPNILGRACFFPVWGLVRPSQDGERLTNTLSGAKDGGRYRQERALVLTSLRRTMRRRALATLSYDNMVPGPKARFQRLVDGLLTRKNMIVVS